MPLKSLSAHSSCPARSACLSSVLAQRLLFGNFRWALGGHTELLSPPQAVHGKLKPVIVHSDPGLTGLRVKLQIRVTSAAGEVLLHGSPHPLENQKQTWIFHQTEASASLGELGYRLILVSRILFSCPANL